MFQHLVIIFLVIVVAMESFYFFMGRNHDIEFRHKMLKLQIESILITASVFCYIGYALWGI